MNALLPHGAVHKGEGLRGLTIVRQERNPLLDAHEGTPALLHGLLRCATICCQSCLRVVDACSLRDNPGRIGGDERHQLASQLCHRAVSQLLHIQYQVSQSRYLDGGRRFGARHIVDGHHAGGKTNSPGRVTRYDLGMNTDTVTNGKAHVASIEHDHSTLFIRLPPLTHGRAVLKDRRTIGCCNGEFWLKDPGFIAAFLGFALLIDQKECHRPAVLRAAYQSPHHHVGLFLCFRAPGWNRPFFQWNTVRLPTNVLSLPHHLRCAFWRLERLAVFALVGAPAHLDTETGSSAVNGEAHADRRRIEAGDVQCRIIIGTVFNAALFRYSQLVEFFREDL